MKLRSLIGIAVVCGTVVPGVAQNTETPKATAPIYRVTVVSRTTKAINYRYRAEATPIDFAGTVILPKGRGKAMVASKQGHTEIDAEFEHLTPPTPFGREYLTYVLWALTPDGSPHNLGEIIPNSSDKASVRVSTSLQAFGLIVTAEPYAAVRRPSDVVVMENQVRPETVGSIEQVNANYDLLPRGHYTWHVPDGVAASASSEPKISSREYEVMLELYQAQNAIGIARAARADQYAPEILAKAEALLDEARQRQQHKGDRTLLLQEAREACQTAEDARITAEERPKQEAVAKLEADAAASRQAQAKAEAAAAQANAQAQAAQAELQSTQNQAEAERAARLQAEAEANAAKEQAAKAQQPRPGPAPLRPDQAELRSRLVQQLNASGVNTQDTARGLVVVVPEYEFNRAKVRSSFRDSSRKLAAVLAPHPTLNLEVEGDAGSAATETDAIARVEAVVESLRSSGLSATASYKGERGRVGDIARGIQIVISGDPIGRQPAMDRTYTMSVR